MKSSSSSHAYSTDCLDFISPIVPTSHRSLKTASTHRADDYKS